MENKNTKEDLIKPAAEDCSENGTTEKPNNTGSEPKAASCNPSIPLEAGDQAEDADNLARIVRGDAIGTTVYSERFVLSTLLKLNKIDKGLAENENFENDLCSLWDMTIEEDVVRLLLEHNIFDIFAHCIQATEDKRLVEIVIGILGNMCNFKEARDTLVEDPAALVQTLLGLTSCSDSLTLLQLTRLLSVVLIHADRKAALQWYQHICNSADFVKNLVFILSNSINEQLLRQCIETLNAILAKFALVEPNPTKLEVGKDVNDHKGSPETVETSASAVLPTFEQLFVNEELIKATIEAFLALLPSGSNTKELQDGEVVDVDDDDDDAKSDSSDILLTQSAHNLMQIFLNIHCILTQYDDLTQSSYEPHIEALMDCFSCILEPLSKPMYVQHLTNREQDLLESLNDILESLGDPFDEGCLMYTINIWNLLRLENERIARRTPPANDFEEISIKEDEFNFETSYLTILDMIVRMVNAASEEQLQHMWKDNVDDENVKNLQITLSIGDSDQETKRCYCKIQKVLENLSHE